VPLGIDLSVAPRFLWECLTSLSVSRLQSPPLQTQRADFPHCAFLLTSFQSLCDLSFLERFRH